MILWKFSRQVDDLENATPEPAARVQDRSPKPQILKLNPFRRDCANFPPRSALGVLGPASDLRSGVREANNLPTSRVQWFRASGLGLEGLGVSALVDTPARCRLLGFLRWD